MKKRINHYYLIITTGLFVGGVIIVHLLSFSSRSWFDGDIALNQKGRAELGVASPHILGESVEKQQGNDTLTNLFFNQKFLAIQQSVLDEKSLQYIPQHVIRIVKTIPPRNVRVYDAQNSKFVTVVWDPFLEEAPSSIKLFRADAPGRKSEMIAELPGTASGYQDTGITLGKEYFYSLVSIGAKGEESVVVGPYSVGPIKDTELPPPPEKVEVSLEEPQDSKGSFKVRIKWQDPSISDLAFINIYRSTQEGVLGTRIAKRAPGAGEYVDTDIDTEEGVNENGVVKYYYVLRSEDIHGNESEHTLSGPIIGNSNPFVPSF